MVTPPELSLQNRYDPLTRIEIRDNTSYVEPKEANHITSIKANIKEMAPKPGLAVVVQPKIGAAAFVNYVSNIWNTDIRQASSLNIFKSMLRTFFTLAFK